MIPAPMAGDRLSQARVGGTPGIGRPQHVALRANMDVASLVGNVPAVRDYDHATARVVVVSSYARSYSAGGT
jgi:hypothetical protein